MAEAHSSSRRVTPGRGSLSVWIAGVAVYALAVYWSSQNPSWLTLLLALLPLFWMAVALAFSAPAVGATPWKRALRCAPLLLLLLGLLGFRHALVANFRLIFFIQHVGVHAALGWIFGASLRRGRMPLCTEFASWVHKDMGSPQLLWYTRQVTKAWALFFLGMAVTSAILYVTASHATWTFFSAVLGPLLTGAMFLIENLARTRFLPPYDRVGLMGTWRAVRARLAAQSAPNHPESR